MVWLDDRVGLSPVPFARTPLKYSIYSPVSFRRYGTGLWLKPVQSTREPCWTLLW
jgi:hypothetical protein